MIEAHVISDVGGRSRQEDSSCVLYNISRHQVGIGIFDGAGAMADGAERSAEAQACVCTLIGQHALGHLSPEVPSILREAIGSAQQQTSLVESEPYTISATTALIAVVVDGFAFVAWSGDSKCWLCRNGQIYQITRPHTLAEEAWCNHEIRRSEIGLHPDGHVITRAISNGCAPSQPDVRVIPVHDADRLIVSSDGLDAVLSDVAIQDLVARHDCAASAEMIANDLLQSSLNLLTPDNVTVGVIRVLDPHQHMPELPVEAGALGALFDHQHYRLEQLDAKPNL